MPPTDQLAKNSIAPGSLVVIRDEEWIVTHTTHNDDGLLVTVQGLSELVAGTSAQFSERYDDIEAMDPRRTRVVSDDSPGHRNSRLWLEATLRKTRPMVPAPRAGSLLHSPSGVMTPVPSRVSGVMHLRCRAGGLACAGGG